MIFHLFMTYTPIDIETKQLLEDLNIVIPFDSEFPENNVYAYVPEGVTTDDLNSIHTFMFYGDEVSEDDVKKHITKIEEVNNIEVGQFVNCWDYRDLPLRVIAVNDVEVEVEHRLRSFTLRETLPLELVYKAEPLEYDFGDIILKKVTDTIYIDFNSISISDTYEVAYTTLFSFLVRLKTMYQDYNLIFINPFSAGESLANDIGIKCMYGSVNKIVRDSASERDLVFSNDLDILRERKTLIATEKNRMIELTFDDEYENDLIKLVISYEMSKSVFHPQWSHQYLDTLLESDKRQTILDKYYKSDYFKKLYNGETFVESNPPVTDIKPLQNKLVDYNLKYFAYNLDNYFRIILN